MELDPKKLGKVNEKVRQMGEIIEQNIMGMAQLRLFRLALLDIKEALRELRTNPPDYDRANNEVPVGDL